MSNLTQLGKELWRLHRDLELPRLKSCEPFDKYAYNAFSHEAARIARELQAFVDEAERLRLLAITSAKLCDGEQARQEAKQ